MEITSPGDPPPIKVAADGNAPRLAVFVWLTEVKEVEYDLDGPRLAVYVWCTDGLCRQVFVSAEQRLDLLEMLDRRGEGALQFQADAVPIEWPGALAGPCHQLPTTMSMRRAIYDHLERAHAFALKIHSEPVPLKWRKEADTTAEEA